MRIAEVRDRAILDGLDRVVVNRLAELLSAHVARCRRAPETGAAT